MKGDSVHEIFVLSGLLQQYSEVEVFSKANWVPQDRPWFPSSYF